MTTATMAIAKTAATATKNNIHKNIRHHHYSDDDDDHSDDDTSNTHGQDNVVIPEAHNNNPTNDSKELS